MRVTRYGGVLVLVALAGGGCGRPHPTTPEERTRGCVFLVPGVEGRTWQLAGTVRGLRDAGLDWAVEPLAWEAPALPMGNLIHLRENLRRARGIARVLAEYRAGHPDAPLVVVGYSGGGGLAVLALEALPADVQVDRAILAGAAVAPRRDLAPAMAHVREVLINFYSREDWFILGTGTRLFGTIDRVMTEAAGHVGFLDDRGELLVRDRLVQHAWMPAWRQFGHFGGHWGWNQRRWAREVLAAAINPALRPAAPATAHSCDAAASADPSGS